MRDSALKLSQSQNRNTSWTYVGEELMRDSALKHEQNAAKEWQRIRRRRAHARQRFETGGGGLQAAVVSVSEKSSCATAL